jgi:membrane-associated protein
MSSVVLALNPFDPRDLLATFGVVGLFIVLFAETGLLIGFFLPGDSLLFTAGLLSAVGVGGPRLPLAGVLIAAAAGALCGAQVGYVIGLRAGSALRADTRHPRVHEGLERAERLLERYGPARAIILARFVPVVRTVLNPLAGALCTPARTFTLWQVVGGLVWTIGLILAGHLLGSSVQGIEGYLLPIVAVIVMVSLLPLVLEVVRGRRRPAPRSGEPPRG